MSKNSKIVVCYLSEANADWGGASRVLFTNIRLLDRDKIEPIVLLPSLGPITTLLDELNVRYLPWGRPHEPHGLIEYIGNIINSMRFYLREKIDILHVNHASLWRPAEALAARMLKIPVISHFHYVMSTTTPFTRKASLAIAVSEFVARSSMPTNIPKQVIHNVVSLDRFAQAHDIRHILSVSDQEVMITFIGQIRDIKGVDLFIELAYKLADNKVKFFLVGECRDPLQYEGSYLKSDLLKKISGNPHIIYLGYRGDIEDIYKSSDIIIIPSRLDEPFGLTAIEAGASGKPVVCSGAGGLPEIVTHGENGFLFKVGDLAELAKYTRALIDSAQLRKKMGSRGLQVVREKFTTQPIRELEKLYERLARN